MVLNNNLDAFWRLRTSNAVGIFEDVHEYDTSPLFWIWKASWTWTLTHKPNYSSVELSTWWTASWAKYTRQTREYIRYQAWKSQLITFSGVLWRPKINVRTRYGYFDDNNWLFFELTQDWLFVVLRSKVSWSVVDIRVHQNNFSIEPWIFDTWDETLFFIDFEWQSAWKVRMWYFDDGLPITVHEFNRDSTFPLPYMTTPNLPIRMEIENTWTAWSITTCLQTCVAVSSEWWRDELKWLPVWVWNWITTVWVTTRRAVLSIRPKATFNWIITRGQIIEQSFELLAKTNDCFFELVYNPTFTTWWWALTWTSANASSLTEYCVHWDANTWAFTWWIVIHSWTIPTWAWSTSASKDTDIISKLPVTLDIDWANPIAFSIVCTSFTGTSNVSGSLNWKEIY